MPAAMFQYVSPRFTELYVEELENEADLRILVSDYLRGLNLQKNVIAGIIKWDTLPYFFFVTCKLCEPPLLMVSVDAQVLLGREEGGQLPPGGRNGPQAALQPTHPVQGPQVRGRQPLQERAEVTVRGRRPASRHPTWLGWKIQRLKHWFPWHSDWCRAFAWASWLSWTGAPTRWSRNWCVSTSCWGTASVSNRSGYKGGKCGKGK